MIALSRGGMTGFMRKLAVVVALLAGVGSSRATPAEKPTSSTSAAKKPVSGGVLGRPAQHKKQTLRFGTPTVSGALDGKVVAAVVKRSKKKLLACYRAALAKNATLSGTATVTFSIAADGKVTLGDATGLDLGARTCITSTIAKLRFALAKADQGTKVSYPLIFKTGPERFAALTGTGVISSGESNIYGGLIGDQIGEGTTYGGIGLRGTGPGGGGTGTGTIGLGTYGTIGHGSGTGSGYGVGRGGLRGSSVAIGLGTATGGLDKAIIRHIIRRHLNKIRYCYEKKLVKHNTLQGTVTAKFTIGVTGHVLSSTAAGMGDMDVESCVAKVIARISFPKPKAGKVVVSYPFAFRLPPPDADATKKPAGANAAKK